MTGATCGATTVYPSESINRRTDLDNTITKRKRTKGETTLYKTSSIKIKIK